MRAVLVHDWLTGMRGGEKVLEAFAELFPEAPILTLVYQRGAVSPGLEAHPIRVSWLGRLPGAVHHYRRLLPLFPAAMATLRVPPADLVVSTSHAAAKAVRKPPGAVHVCYCFTPMRYLWDLYDDYFGPERAGLATRAAMRVMRGPLRRWDVATARGVDRWLAVSGHVRERIRRLYGCDAEVLYPWVDLERFTPGPEKAGPRYLVVSALVPYKRIDLAIDAAARLGRGLDIVGSGPDEGRLKAAAAASGGDIRFLGWLEDSSLAGAYRRAHALVMPGEEDFGIAPLEAMASGRPVVAWGRGGALETIVDGETGVLVGPRSAETLAEAMLRSETIAWSREQLRSQAERFSRASFLTGARARLGLVAPD